MQEIARSNRLIPPRGDHHQRDLPLVAGETPYCAPADTVLYRLVHGAPRYVRAFARYSRRIHGRYCEHVSAG